MWQVATSRHPPHLCAEAECGQLVEHEAWYRAVFAGVGDALARVARRVEHVRPLLGEREGHAHGPERGALREPARLRRERVRVEVAARCVRVAQPRVRERVCTPAGRRGQPVARGELQRAVVRVDVAPKLPTPAFVPSASAPWMRAEVVCPTTTNKTIRERKAARPRAVCLWWASARAAAALARAGVVCVELCVGTLV